MCSIFLFDTIGEVEDKILKHSDAIIMIGRAGKVSATEIERFIEIESSDEFAKKKYGIILVI